MQASHNDGLQSERCFQRGGWFLAEDAEHHAVHIAREGQVSRADLIQHYTKRVDVREDVSAFAVLELFRGEVADGPQKCPALGDTEVVIFGEAKVT